MKGIKIICIAAMALIMLLMPYAGFAQVIPPDPGPQWNIVLEFRYTEGEEGSVVVPNNIVRYGRGYHLISQAAPVLEQTLPSTRTYSWNVEGFATAAELAELQNIPGITVTPASITIDRLVDRSHTYTGLPSNDVDSPSIVLTMAFPITDSPSNGLTTNATLERVGVKFEIESYENNDPQNLPETYKAEVVYRGLAPFTESGYQVTATYQTTEALDGVPQYVVVATYAPDVIPGGGGGGGGGGGAVVPPPAGGGGGQAVEPPANEEPGGEEPGGEEPGGEQPGGDGGDGGTTIPGGDTPTGPGGGQPGGDQPGNGNGTGTEEPPASTFKAWMLIPIFVAVALAVLCLVLVFRDRAKARENDDRREARRKASMRAHGLVDYD